MLFSFAKTVGYGSAVRYPADGIACCTINHLACSAASTSRPQQQAPNRPRQAWSVDGHRPGQDVRGVGELGPVQFVQRHDGAETSSSAAGSIDFGLGSTEATSATRPTARRNAGRSPSRCVITIAAT